MKNINFLLFTFYFSLFTFYLDTSAQVNVRDSSIFAPMITVHYSYQIPGNDLAKRFGNNSNIGGSFMIKTKSNWIAGADYNFIFGNIIREDTVLKIISTSDGGIITGKGILADVSQFERGFYTALKFGKVFPFYGPNPNSGIIITASGGLFQHKIRTEVIDNSVPELLGEYKKGYDHLANGLAISEFIGYLYMGNNRMISFYAGLEFMQSRTQSRRTWDFDRMGPDKSKRYDTLYGIKFGWIIPLYKRASKGGYYYF